MPRGAAALFNDESYWRDLVAFTRNIATAEGNAKVREMIERAVIPARPSGFTLEGDATLAGGVTEGWIHFETPVARGYGHVRLDGGKAWTLLTTMTELPRRRARPQRLRLPAAWTRGRTPPDE